MLSLVEIAVGLFLGELEMALGVGMVGSGCALADQNWVIATYLTGLVGSDLDGCN